MSTVYNEVDEKYAAICSLQTICQTEGFFNGLIENFIEIARVDDWLENVLAQQSADAGKLSAITANKSIMNELKNVMSRIKPVMIKRNVRSFSQAMVDQVQVLMRSGNFVKALQIINMGVMFATQSVDESIEYNISSALWLRSEVLLELGRHELALRDLKLALNGGLTVKLRPNYYWRLGHAYRGMGNIPAAKTSFHLAVQLQKKPSEDIVTKIDREIEELTTIQSYDSSTKKEIKITLGSKKNLSSLSKLVNIVEKENMGRFAVADKHIKTGSVLLAEMPYAACLDPQLQGSHCLHCFKRLEAPISCMTCTNVAFCDVECQQIALSTYHRYECKFSDMFRGSGMSLISLLALRMVTQAGLETCKNLHAHFLSSNVKPVDTATLNDIEGCIFDDKTPQPSTSPKPRKYKQATSQQVEPEDQALRTRMIYSLCTHNEFRKPIDYLQRFMMATFLMECLLQTDFFKVSNDLRKDKKIVLELLLRNLQILQFNAHQLYEVIRGSHSFDGSKTKYTAIGIYPTASLFNHECYPNVARYFNGKNIVLRTTRPIYAGGMVSEHYGPNFLTHDLQYRQRELACRYWFKCKCTPCIENWSKLETTMQEPMLCCPNVLCTNKFTTKKTIPAICSKCKTPLHKDIMTRNRKTLQEVINNFEKGAKLMSEQKVDEAMKTLMDAMDSYQGVGAIPFKPKHIAEEALRACYTYYGNIQIEQKKP